MVYRVMIKSNLTDREFRGTNFQMYVQYHIKARALRVVAKGYMSPRVIKSVTYELNGP